MGWSNPMIVDTCVAFPSSIRRTIQRLATSLVAAAAMLSISGADAPLRAAEIRSLSAASIQEFRKSPTRDDNRQSGNQQQNEYDLAECDLIQFAVECPAK
jgi:hypothetical protein